MPSSSQLKTTYFLATISLWMLSILFEQNPPAWCCLPQLRPVLRSTEWGEREARSRTMHQEGGWSQSQVAQALPHLIPPRLQKPVASQFHEGAGRLPSLAWWSWWWWLGWLWWWWPSHPSGGKGSASMAPSVHGQLRQLLCKSREAIPTSYF